MAALYEDSLVRIETERLTIKRYYLPFAKFGERRVPAEKIEKIEKKPLDSGSGKWRIWGTSSFTAWMPFDGKRPSRDAVFWLHLKDTSFRIGFTVENTERVTRVLDNLHLLAS